MRIIRPITVSLALLASLAACGATTQDQAIIGGAAGAGAAVVTGGSPVKGGILGAAGNVLYCQYRPQDCN